MATKKKSEKSERDDAGLRLGSSNNADISNSSAGEIEQLLGKRKYSQVDYQMLCDAYVEAISKCSLYKKMEPLVDLELQEAKRLAAERESGEKAKCVSNKVDGAEERGKSDSRYDSDSLKALKRKLLAD